MTAPTIEWSTLAAIPPDSVPKPLLPGYKDFDRRVRGRSGDLVVVQIKSANGLTADQRAALRTLNLRGMSSMSLRLKEDPSTLGNIALVRDFVAVVDLNGIYYKSNHEETELAQYEILSYGTSTRPGGLVRDVSGGDYFAFESDRNNLLIMWASQLAFQQTLELFIKHFDDPEPERSADAATVGLTGAIEDVPERVDVHGDGISIVDGPTREVIAVARKHATDVRFARLGFRHVELTWQEPHQRFEDLETEAAEVGLYSADLDLQTAKGFALDTGGLLIEDAPLSVQVRKQGNLKTLNF